MCWFCENIAKDDKEFIRHRFNGGDFIYKDQNGYSVFIDTGDSFCCGNFKINYCPMCSRDLSIEGNGEKPKIRIESDGHLTQVWIDGERVSDKATTIDFHAEPLEVYCEIEKFKLDEKGNRIVENDDLLREKVVVIDTRIPI